MAENKRLSSNLRSGAALVNESLGIIADALRPGDRDRDADPPPAALPPVPPTAAASEAGTMPTSAACSVAMQQQPPGNPQNDHAAAKNTVAQAGAAVESAGVTTAANVAGNGAASIGRFERPAGWPEEEPPGFRAGLLRDMGHG